MRRDTLEWVAEFLTFVFLIGSLIYFLSYWDQLPDRVPTHYGFSGRPDKWGQKTNLWILPSINLLIWIWLTVASKFNQFINLPGTVDRTHPDIQKILLNFSIVLKLMVVSTISYLTVQSVRVSKGLADGLGNSFLVMSGLVIILVVIFYQSRLKKAQQAVYDAAP